MRSFVKQATVAAVLVLAGAAAASAQVLLADDFSGTVIDPTKWTVVQDVHGGGMLQDDELIFSQAGATEWTGGGVRTVRSFESGPTYTIRARYTVDDIMKHTGESGTAITITRLAPARETTYYGNALNSINIRFEGTIHYQGSRWGETTQLNTKDVTAGFKTGTLMWNDVFYHYQSATVELTIELDTLARTIKCWANGDPETYAEASFSQQIWDNVLNGSNQFRIEEYRSFATSSYYAHHRLDDWEIAIAPGDPYVLYHSRRAGTLDIWAVDMAGNQRHITSKAGEEGNPRVSPDGRSFCYIWDGAGDSTKRGIWVASLDGSSDRMVHNDPNGTAIPNFFAPLWSPDGSKLLYFNDAGPYRGQIRVINADGTNDRLLLAPSSPNTFAWPTDWKRSTILFHQGYAHSGLNSLWVAKDDGTGRQQLASSPADLARFDPAGERISYFSSSSIMMMNADGSGKHLVYYPCHRTGLIPFSPAGDLLAVAGFRHDSEANDVYLIGATPPFALQQLTSTADIHYVTDFARAVIPEANQPPTADAGPDQVVAADAACEAAVALDGTRSSDPDGDPLAYLWTGEAFGAATGPAPVVTFPAGAHEVTMTVDDGRGASDSDGVRITVADQTAPSLACPAPVEVSAGPTCQAAIPDVSAGVLVSDNCTEPGGLQLTQAPAPGVLVGIGAHAITATATDEAGISGSCAASFTVGDASAPEILALSATPSTLWPPNHQMVGVDVTAIAQDNCAPETTCTISAVTSNEPENGLGDGDAYPDWKVLGPLAVSLRAERSGTGAGRTYTITVTCTDAAGNASSSTAAVQVPKSQKK